MTSITSVEKRLVPLHVDHAVRRGSTGSPGQAIAISICNRSDAPTAGAAVGGSHQYRKTPTLSQLTQLFTVGAKHDSVRLRFTTAFENPDHQLATDIRQQFIRQREDSSRAELPQCA